MDRKSVALLGSSCDPVTLAHADLLNFALEAADEAWIMPCYDHAFGKNLAAPDHRLAMCKLIETDRIKAFDFEIRNKLGGQTYYTICRLLAESPAVKYSFVIGMDVANTFPGWHHSDRLQQLIPFIVVPRHGVEPKKDVDWYTKWPHKVIDKGSQRNTSSHEVRAMIQANDPKVSEHLHPTVLEYIQKHNLYRSVP